MALGLAEVVGEARKHLAAQQQARKFKAVEPRFVRGFLFCELQRQDGLSYQSNKTTFATLHELPL